MASAGDDLLRELHLRVDHYVGRARRLGDTVSREQIIALQVAWDNTRARCCGFRADLPLGLCAACIRDGAVALDGADIAALTEHLWAVGNPVRAALARYVADVLRDPAADPRFRAFAKRLLMRRT